LEAHQARPAKKEREEGERKMAKGIYKKVTAVGRATTFAVGLAVMLALTVGLASTALAGTGVGARFQLGQTNTVNAITKLVGSVAGPSLQVDNNSADPNATALDLQVEGGKAPMKVNSDAQVANLNADKIDGKSASEIGVNGLRYIEKYTAYDSSSPKTAFAECPAGTRAIGSGYFITGGTNNVAPYEEANVVVDDVHPYSYGRYVKVTAIEEEPISGNWGVTAIATCATAE
jgi:hypothetical protein